MRCPEDGWDSPGEIALPSNGASKHAPEFAEGSPGSRSSADERIDELFRIISAKSIVRNSESKIYSPRGTIQSWLVDLRRTFFDPDGLNLIADLFWDRFADKFPFQVGGLEVGAVPLISAIQLRGLERGLRVNGFVVRKERKNYGLTKTYEGVLTDEPIVVVDDLLNSAETVEKVRVVLAQSGRSIRDLFVVINYQNSRGIRWLKRNAVRLEFIYTLAPFGLQLNAPRAQIKQAEFAEVWQFTRSGGHYFDIEPGSTPALDEARLYFGSEDGNFWALDQTTGEPAWTFRINCSGRKKIRSSPAIRNGRIYFGAYDGNVYCLDAIAGKEQWRFAGADRVGSSPSLAPNLDMLFIGLQHSLPERSGSIAALHLSTGKKIWEFAVKGFVYGSPVYNEQLRLVACGTSDGGLLLFGPTTRTLVWRFDAGGDIKTAPAFDPSRNAVIVGAFDGSIHSIDLATGNARWTVKTNDAVYCTPLVVDDRIYITSTDKHLYVLDAHNGGVLLKFPTPGKNYASPRLIRGRVYFGSSSGMVYELDPGIAAITGQVQLPERLTDAITYSEATDIFFAKSYDGKVYAFRRVEEPA